MPDTNRVVRADASEEDKKLINLVLDAKERFGEKRWIFEREWYRNILFYLGQQWITYEDGFRRWRLRNMPNWVPLPVTNRLASTANVIRASVAQVQPAFTAFPTRENEQSILSANAADKYLEVIMQESGFRAARRRMASWVTLTGNGFIMNEFDTSTDTGTVFVPGEVCQDCGFQMRPQEIPATMACPQCGSTALVEDEASGTNIPQGRMRVSALSPFEVYVDNLIPELDDQPAILLVQRRALESVKQTYGSAANDVVADVDRDTSQYYLTSLAHMTGTGFGTGQSANRSNDSETGGVTLYRLYIKTCKEYPDGAFITMTGDQHILEKEKPYPFRYKATGRPFFPITHVRYDDVPGRFWAKTPIDDLVIKQRQRNEIESLYQTIIMRCANPVWLLPVGVQTSPITGDPGIQVRYTPQGGMKPERLQGIDAPASITNFMTQIDQDFEEIANTFAVMKGKNPGSVRAASAIQMLLERGFGRYGSVFDNLEEAYETWAIQALELWRQKAVFPRVQAIAKAAGSWQFMEFLGSDIGEVDIRVEAGSTRPKSQAARQMLVGQALQWGLLNPQDPEQKMKIFEEMGMQGLLPGAEADIKVVAEENTKFMSWAQNATKQLESAEDLPPEEAFNLLLSTFPMKGNMILDHHPTHVVHHRRLALSDAFRALPQVFQDLFVQHLMTEHLPYLVQEAMTGMGVTGVMSGVLAAQKGTPGQETSKSGAPTMGAGPGGAQSPFGGSKSGADSGTGGGGAA